MIIKQPITEPYTLYKKWTGKGQKDKIDANFFVPGQKDGLERQVCCLGERKFFYS